MSETEQEAREGGHVENKVENKVEEVEEEVVEKVVDKVTNIETKDEEEEVKEETKEEIKEAEKDKEPEVAEPDVTLLKSQFCLFAKFGDKTADGKTIKLSQSDKWFKQAGVFQPKGVSTTDTGIAFRKIAKNNTKITFEDWRRYLEEISTSRQLPVGFIHTKLGQCGRPGTNGATKITTSTIVDRLTDTSKYGGTHRERFDESGKGRGKEGRVDGESDGYVTGYKHKGSYTKTR